MANVDLSRAPLTVQQGVAVVTIRIAGVQYFPAREYALYLGSLAMLFSLSLSSVLQKSPTYDENSSFIRRLLLSQLGRLPSQSGNIHRWSNARCSATSWRSI